MKSNISEMILLILLVACPGFYGCGKSPADTAKRDKPAVTDGAAVAQPDGNQVPAQKIKAAVNLSIHTAVKDGELKKVAEYLSEGTDVNLKDTEGFTPLHWAAYRNKTDIVKLLIEKGADPNIVDDKGFTPLHRAAFMGYPEITKLLVATGCNLDIQNTNGLTARFIAEKMNRTEVAAILRDAGAKDIQPKAKP